MRKKEIKPIGGIGMEILYDEDTMELDIELVKYRKDIPCLEFNVNNKKVFRLHILEAIELKALIDKLCFDYLWMKSEGDIE